MLIVDQHGEYAGDFAERRADLLMEESDMEDSAVWRRIFEAKS